MILLAIDPGPVESAWFRINHGVLSSGGKLPNDHMLAAIVSRIVPDDVLVIEKVASYGMPVGEDVFETVYWSGRFAQAFGGRVERVPRIAVKMHLCHNSRAKDGNIRQALIDRYGKPGTKKNPGPLYGVTGDLWSALAVGLTWLETAAELGRVA